jgi:hypothetical protein
MKLNLTKLHTWFFEEAKSVMWTSQGWALRKATSATVLVEDALMSVLNENDPLGLTMEWTASETHLTRQLKNHTNQFELAVETLRQQGIE